MASMPVSGAMLSRPFKINAFNTQPSISSGMVTAALRVFSPGFAPLATAVFKSFPFL